MQSDNWAKKARNQGYRSRAVFKLKEILEDIANGCGPKNSLLALGYAGWGPGQLENEIFSDSWLVCESDPNLIFTIRPEFKWNDGLKKLGVEPSQLSTLGGNA